MLTDALWLAGLTMAGAAATLAGAPAPSALQARIAARLAGFKV